MYGGTEGFATTQLNGAEWLEHRGSVGKPTWSEVLIRGDDGAALPPGEIGEIYMRRKGATGEDKAYHYVGADGRRLPDGFESFGDYGWVDKDGYLYIADRRTDLILSGGRNLYPAEIEAALLAHPEVAEAIVIGLPDGYKVPRSLEFTDTPLRDEAGKARRSALRAERIAAQTNSA